MSGAIVSMKKREDIRGSRVGVDSIERVFLMENHDQAYHIWREARVKQKILIHIDAHHDMRWISDLNSITIANFICPALKDEIVREVYWVVPDGTWEDKRSRRALMQQVRMVASKYPGGPNPIAAGNDEISTSVMGRPLRVCSLRSLPGIQEDVLLDIDVDYLVIPRVSYGETDKHEPLPWCWPEELVAGLRARNILSELVTIVYSVEGGYTPLKWKYFGDELAARLRSPNHEEATIRGTGLIRLGALAAHREDLTAAESKYREAIDLMPGSPVPHYHLAHLLYLVAGRTDEARKSYQKALTLDSSYRSPYNSRGLHYYTERHFAEAEEEHRRILSLDPQDPYALFGLGRLAARRKRWNQAEVLLRKSLAHDGNLINAYRWLGKVLIKQGQHGEAIAAYERSLKLAMAGYRPLEGDIVTRNEGDPPRLLDSHHCRTHARLARLYELQGATTRAINGYRISIAGGYNGVLIRSCLARLYLKQHQWQLGAKEAWQAMKTIPADLMKAGYELRRWLRSVIRGDTKVGMRIKI
jgi:tetratricopeptide (TPR) repeat protein